MPFCLGSLGDGLDLHAALIPNPVCTFYMRASGNGMRQHGINDGDLMVIDRSVEPCSVLRQAPWPIRDNQVGRWVSLMAPRLSPATTWGRRHEN